MNYLFRSFTILCLCVLMSCKTKSVPSAPVSTIDPVLMNKSWSVIDSLEKKGLLSSALTEVRKVKQMALEGKDSGHLVKAIVYENKYLNQLEEDSAIKALDRVEAEINTYPEPAKSVMHSLAAQWYGNYLQTHLWELRNRTEFSGTAGPDIRTWGIRHFIDRIHHHFDESVRWEGLRAIPVGDYPLLLTEKQNTDELRPMLYDILVHRAIDFYSGTESFLTQPAYAFTLTDEKSFLPAELFKEAEFNTNDTLSNTWQALRLFQHLLDFRLQQQDQDAALLDADLRRLRFVHQHIIHDQKDSLYHAGLKSLSAKHAGHPESALVDYYRAELLAAQASQWSPTNNSKYRYAYNEALAICQQAINKFPDAYGSQLCKNLIGQINTKSISANIESVNLPGEAILTSIEYRNIDSIWLKLVKLPEAPRRWKADNLDNIKILDRLNQLTAVKAWEQKINDGGDHQQHFTEIGIDGQSVGHYALLISDRRDFDSKLSTTGVMMFTVSELGYWYIDSRDQSQIAAVVHRDSGQPLAGVKAEFYSYQYVAGRQKQTEVKLGEATSDKNGWVTVPSSENQSVFIRLTKGQDELFEEEGYHTFRNGRDFDIDPSTLFFSDRAIYRPGQKIYFKGYALDFDQHRIPKIVPGKKIEVTLYDANHQEQQKKTFTSNDYGTFSGHFDLPQGGLTGQMSLSSSHGASRHYFQVEEYKRPKFEITFDSLIESVKLDDEVSLRGYAKDYAGSPVPNAEVRYRVERVAFIPWWYGQYWKGFWPGDEDRIVLETGQAFTNQDGSFQVNFNARAKAGGDPNLMYRFETTVYITDITGESHELSKSIVVNRQGYEVNLVLPDKISADALKSVAVSAINSDGVALKVTGELEVSEIQGPSSNKRDRLWTTPDILTIAENEYQHSFPDYYVPGQEDQSKWNIVGSKGKRSYAIQGMDSIDISSLFPKPGFYKLAWKWRDEKNNILDIIQFVMVYVQNTSLPGHEVIEISFDHKPYQPGENVSIDLLTGLVKPPQTIRVIERMKAGTHKSWYILPTYDDKSIKIGEEDRGGIHLHHLTVFNNRFYQDRQTIQVPWSNKDLDLELTTWRDQMEPGDEETWTIKVKGPQKDAVTAEMLLSMYDASLDAFVPHQWQMNLYPSTMSRLFVQGSMTRSAYYWGLTHHWTDHYTDIPYRQYRDINVYGYYPEGSYGGYIRRYKHDMDMAVESIMLESAPAAPPSAKDAATGNAAGEQREETESTGSAPERKDAAPPLRTALDETVFFFPQIKTDATGNLTFSFKMKEGLTRWKFQALAHTADLKFGLTQAEAVTQKQLMVFPNPPRFFREGDTIAFQIKATNLTPQIQSGSAHLKIIDATDEKDVSAIWGIQNASKDLKISATNSIPMSWMVTVPRDWVTPVKYQVYITAGNFTDGEEAMIPVVTNRILVTETLPLPLKANESRTFVFKSMQSISATADPFRYTVEMTTTPAWYAVQALPYLMEYPHECAEQIFNRFYANTLASHIVQKVPDIKKVYDTWRATNDDALLSNLEKNQELKSAMLEETPWVRDAMGETSAKKDIALLFETNRLRNESLQAIGKLEQMQLANGAFPWFPGGTDHWYITQYIIEGFGHLRKLGATNFAGNERNIVERAIPYLDNQMLEWYADLKRRADNGKLKLEDHHITSIHTHYLYTRSFYASFDRSNELNEVINYVKSQAEKYWLQHGMYDQGMIALGMNRMFAGNALSKEILASLRERTIFHEELGRYWKLTPGFYWNEAPVEIQSLMVELFQDMKVAQAETDELRVWLLKQKQTTRWQSTKATAAAIYALLIHPDSWLDSEGIVEVKIGNSLLANENSEPGTGYIKRSWPAEEIKNNWSEIKVNNPNNHIAWGAAYWQYWEDIDKVREHDEFNPLQVSRQLLITQQTDRGEVTTEAVTRKLKVGDKLVVRLIIESDRTMEFIHLKDLRASGFEPMDVISGYRWNNGIGYYQSTKDLATHFFIDYLPRGKYIIEYPVTVAQEGAFSEGMATLQCMYAPEFSDHSEGRRVAARGLVDKN